jgi:hypothetical protein
MNNSKIIEAIERFGLSIVCATCKKYWMARERGLYSGCLAEGKCGSPIVGDDFCQYDGEIPDLSLWCFVCGKESDFGIRVKGRERTIGVCREHISFLHNMEPKASGYHTDDILVCNNGVLLQLEAVIKAPKPTLMQEIVKTEMEWAEKDRAIAEKLGEALGKTEPEE